MAIKRTASLPLPPDGRYGWPWMAELPTFPPLMPDNKPWPKISIVTPSYNQGQFLEETIRSVLLQGYPTLEYIIIDGGSTDNSVAVIKKYEQLLSYWVSEPDRGQTHAINKGFARARGDILAYLNSDDTYAPGVLQSAVSVFAENPDEGIVYGDCNFINETGTVMRTVGAPDPGVAELLKGARFGQPAGFIRRTVYEEIGSFNETLHYIMDYEYWLRAALRGVRFEHINETWANLRMWSDCKTVGQEWEMALEQLSMLNSLKVQPDAGNVPAEYWADGLANASLWVACAAFRSDRLEEGVNHLMGAVKYAPLLIKKGRKAIAAEVANVFVQRYEEEALTKSKPLLKSLNDQPGEPALLARQILAWLHARIADWHWTRKELSASRRHIARAMALKPGLFSDRHFARLFFKSVMGLGGFSRGGSRRQKSR